MAKKQRNARIIMKGSNVPGVIPTIPLSNDHTDGTWLDTDIYEKEYFFNTADKKIFTRMGGIVVDVDFVITPNFTITDFTPQEIDEQSSGNSIVVTGTSFKDNMTVRIPDTTIDDGGGVALIFSNVSLTYTSPTSVTVNFDVAGDQVKDQTFNIYLDKEGYETNISMNADTDMTIQSMKYNGAVNQTLIKRTSAEDIQLLMNELISNITLVETDNVNVTVNSNDSSNNFAYPLPGDINDGSSGFNIQLDSSGTAPDETFKIRVTGDGETSQWYDLAVYPALAIDSIEPSEGGYNTSASEHTLSMNWLISSLTNVESNNANVVVGEFSNVGEGVNPVSVSLDTTAATYGEEFSLRVTGDGETTDWFTLNISWAYVEFNVVGTAANVYGGYDGITGWDKVTTPTLFILTTGGYSDIKIYDNVTDWTNEEATQGVVAITSDGNTIIEQNSSGFGGTISYSGGGTNAGEKFWVHAPGFTYTEVDEVGTSSTNLTNYEGILGWDKIDIPTLYFYCANDIPTYSDGYEIYDNASDRDARTSSAILAYMIPGGGGGALLEQNSSGFGGIMSGSTLGSVGDKCYTTTLTGTP